MILNQILAIALLPVLAQSQTYFPFKFSYAHENGKVFYIEKNPTFARSLSGITIFVQENKLLKKPFCEK